MLKKTIFAVGLAAITSSAFAVPHFYIGAGVGSGSLHQKVQVNSTQTNEFSAHYKLAWTGRLGLMVTDHWGVELGQNYFQDDTSNNALITIKSNNNKVTYLALKGAFDISPLITIYGKAGPAYTQNELDSVTAFVLNQKIKKNHAITAYGALGVEFNVAPTFGFFLEASGNTRSGNVPGTTMLVGGFNLVFG